MLNQTYKNIELIVVDDCSTDDTAEILKTISDSRFTVITHTKNKGQNAARNTGTLASHGELIACHDSDDVWHTDKLEKQLDFLKTTNADIVCAMTAVYDETNNKFMNYHPDLKKVSEGELSFINLLKYNCTTSQTFLGKAECFKKILFDEKQPRFTDWALALDMLHNKFKIYFQAEVLADVFQQKDSITKNPQKGIAGMNMLFEKYKDDILSDKEATVSFFKKMSSFTCRCGKNPVMEMERIKTAEPSFTNKLKYLLAKCGLYKTLFMLKN